MYRISELAALVGLSRSTLLYYGKLGLIKATRQSNGYRSYSERDLQRVRLLQQLQAGGLTLKECLACLEAKVDRQLLESRLDKLDEEIEQKRQSRDLLAAMLGKGDIKAWHESIDNIAPDAHLDWLVKQGFDEKQALRLKWLSKDMNEHDQYMADFERIFEGLDRLGPGTEQDTLAALKTLPSSPENVLEIGCGKGVATVVLANHLEGNITSIDNDKPALDIARERLTHLGLENKVDTICASMTALPFEPQAFDLIWSEGSAYIMGVSQAMQKWRRYLSDNGVLLINDLVWKTDTPSEQARSFWAKEYPDMTTIEARIQQAKAAGYEVIDNFPLSQTGWEKYYHPLNARIQALASEMPESAAMQDIQKEIDVFLSYRHEYDYQFFVLKKAQRNK